MEPTGEILLERVNRATAGYPFLEWNARNLSYIPHLHEEIEIVYAAQGRRRCSRPLQPTAGGGRGVCFYAL